MRRTLCVWIATCFLLSCGGGANIFPDVQDEDLASTPDIPADLAMGDLSGELAFVDVADAVEAAAPEVLEDIATEEPELQDQYVPEMTIEDAVGENSEDLEWSDEKDIEPDLAWPGLLGCHTHDDCAGTGICLENYDHEMVCFPWCDSQDDCPEGYSCLVPLEFEDGACFPNHPNQCRPCNEDEDCQPASFPAPVSCLSWGGEGRFCTTECDVEDPQSCPEQYVCKQVQDLGGDPVQRCMPLPGEFCECQPYMNGSQTDCYKTNEIGSCTGVRQCAEGQLEQCSALSPSEEICDGVDNNCNGVVDENLTPPPCVLQFDSGACQIEKECLEGAWKCPQPLFDDICDVPNLDCFWWGAVMDTDEDGYPDVCDVDDDADGFADEEDCAPLDPSSYPGAPETCDGKDNDCNEILDYDQMGTQPCSQENQWGQCSGSAYCIEGKWKCTVVPPGPDHCPGMDDDCSFKPLGPTEDLDGDGTPNFCDVDLDGDGLINELDNCPDEYNPGQFDLEDDGIGDLCDDDDDNDDVMDWDDCCPYDFDPLQKDSDDDGTCDGCDPDDDNDGVPDLLDNCSYLPNPEQVNTDQDDFGNVCDIDDDGDEVNDDKDNCQLTPNMFQENNDGDAMGDACDVDDDNDNVVDNQDNCVFTANEDQADLDEDGEGNLCDDDVEGDGIPNDQDNCPLKQNEEQINTDGDQLGDECDPDLDNDGDLNHYDNCPYTQNSNQLDTDDDCPPTPYVVYKYCGDACDPDLDGDGILEDGNQNGQDGDIPCTGGETENCDDNCPATFNPEQTDINSDGVGEACTGDQDADGILDGDDNCQKTPNADQLNSDDDPLGDACDADDDNDDIFDIFDNCPLVPNAQQEDSDLDGIGDACDE